MPFGQPPVEQEIRLLYKGIRSTTLSVGASDTQDTSGCDYICDGTADEVEINQAIAALPAGGGLIHLLEGTYNINGQITIDKDNVAIIGTGANTHLRLVNNHNAVILMIYALNRNNLLIKDLRVDGNRANQVPPPGNVMWGISFVLCTNSIIESCHVDSHVADGINLDRSTHNRIIGNFATDNGWAGIHLFHNSNYNTVDANVVSDVNLLGGGGGIYLENACSHNTVGNNVVENAWHGIYIHFNNPIDNVVEGNTCSGCVAEGARISGISFVVAGNTFVGNGTRGLYVAGNYITVVGNTISGNQHSGMYVINSNHCTIVGNDIANNGLDADVTYDGILISDSDYCNFQGNLVRTTVGAPPPNRQRYGINVSNVGCDGCLVANNDLYQAGQTGNYNDAGTNTRGTPDGQVSVGVTASTLVVAATDSIDPTRADYQCDGVTDQVEINAAITALGAIGGTVKLLEGTYNITASINLASDVSLIGQGSGTLLFIPNGTDGTFNVIEGNGVDHLLVKDLHIDGNRANQAAGNMQGIYFTGAACDHSRITGCWVENMFGTATTEGCGIHLYDGGDATIIDDNELDNNYGIGIYVEGRITGCDRVTVSDNLCIGNDEDGIRLDESDDVIIDGNVCYANGEDGISLGQVPLNAPHGCVVSGNIVSTNGYHGIHLFNCTHATIEGNSVIENSEDTDVTYDGIYLESGCDYNNIQGNTIRTTVAANRHRYGINIANANCDGNLVKGNDLYQAGQTGLFNDVGTDTRLPELWVNSIFDDSDANANLSNIGDHVSIAIVEGMWEPHIRFNFRVPSDFHELMRARVLVVSAANGNMAWGVATDWGQCDEAYNNGSDGIPLALTAMIALEIECLDVNAALDGITAGDHVGMDFFRDAGDVGDTVTTTHLIGFWMQYV